MNINVNIDAPELAAAINNLAKAFNSVELPQASVEKSTKEITKDTKKAKEDTKEVEPDTKEENTPGLKFEDVRVKLAEVSQKGKQKELKELITSMGADKLSDIPESKYAELLEKASEL